MISKRKLRERLIDICNGAGMEWMEGDQYFECHNDQLESIGNVIQACERAFSLGSTSRLRTPWRLSDFDDLDKLVELVHECLLYDVDA